ncbi:MAG: D-alanyl-D-alanine carboxypeptidase/D-alanyl-D-alanine-endopeptidase, partial [Actinobacteria bacterium]|nr:D-alanyl-D-alanine carboxypeptidase/D-alanyl-D-alanine-endopeptidase [Actinomycetota bacterium]
MSALDREVDALLDEPLLAGAHVGMLAVDVRDGRVVYARRADDVVQPASTAKLIVGSVALEVLGPAWRARTTLSTDGTVGSDGVVHGNLILRGGGDPLLRAADLDAAAAALANAGITSIDGAFLIDNSLFDQARYAPGWTWDDFPFYYAPKVSGMMLEDDVLHVTVTPGTSAGAPASIAWAPLAAADTQPEPGCPAWSDDVHLVSSVVTGNAHAEATDDVGWAPCGVVAVTGTIPLGARPDVIDAAVPSPERYVQLVFDAALAAHHVTVTQPDARTLYGAPVVTKPVANETARILWTHDGEPLRDLVADMWFPSDNLVAESLLRQIAVAANGAPGSAAHGTRAELKWLASLGVDVKHVRLVDGSGLSAYDRVTPRTLVTILRHDWSSPLHDVILDDLPVAGVRGTLASSWRGTAAERHVFAKDGAMSQVRGLAGFVETRRHGTIVFALSIDDFLGDYAALDALRGRVVA